MALKGLFIIKSNGMELYNKAKFIDKIICKISFSVLYVG